MTAEEFWNKLDTLANSKDRTGSLVEVGALLKQAYDEDLPVLIACRRARGRVYHRYAVFDEQNPDLQANRFLLCFTSKKQSEKKPVIAPKQEHPETLTFEESEDESEQTGKRRMKKKSRSGTWKPVDRGEVTKVSVRKVINNLNKNRAIGGLLFNLYDEKHSMAIPKFLIN